MSKHLFSYVALIIATGLGLLIAGAVLPCAVKLCMQEKRAPPPPGFFPYPRRERIGKNAATSDDKEDTICLQQGLFFVGIQEKNSMMYIVTPLENRSKQVRVVAGLLLIGGIGAALAELIFIVGACRSVKGDPKKKQLSIKRGVIGTMILAVSFVLLLSGMGMYTSLKVQGMKTAKDFILDVGSALSGMDKNLAIDHLRKSPLGPPPPPPMQEEVFTTTEQPQTIDPPIANDTAQQNFTELLSTLNPQVVELIFGDFDSPWFPVPLNENDFIITTTSGRVKRSPRKMKTFPGMMTLARFVMAQSLPKPYFGYAFYLCWVGIAALFVAVVCGLYYRLRQGYLAKVALSNVSV